MDIARSMLLKNNAPKSLRSEVVNTANYQVVKIHVNLNRINNGNFWDVSPRDSSDDDEKDGLVEENLRNDRFVHNMSNKVKRNGHPLELHDTNEYVNVTTHNINNPIVEIKKSLRKTKFPTRMMIL
jgi:hypothetical protein